MKKMNFYNEYGGFDENGNYVITGTRTPSPWVNILANPTFGTLITQSGACHTWYGNSSLFRITPRIDDPVLEKSGELLFIKNESNGRIWQPLKTANRVEHRPGSTIFTSNGDLESEIIVVVDHSSAKKIIKIKLHNKANIGKTFSVSYYLQPVLGEFIEKTKADIQTTYDINKKLLLAKNPGSFYFPKAITYLGTSEKNISYSMDRVEFLGKNFKNEPIGLRNKKLPSKNIIANDSALVLKADFDLGKNEEKTLYFYLGVFKDQNEKSNSKIIINDKKFDSILVEIEKYWKGIQSFEIKTPNKALNTLANQWLLYQVISSRLWGKLGFWQPGGAYGFRDQLQDTMSLVWSEPDVLRSQLLLSASRQFMGGDVQHWWHPPRGDGVRSGHSDTALWLVYALNYYIDKTGDDNILDELIPYLKAENKGQATGSYFAPEKTEDEYTLYEHCILAIERTLYLIGEHGLPLILGGDWNDSFGKVGINKKGESVWLAQFLIKILRDFIPICEKRKDSTRASVYTSALAKLEINYTKTWDGKWYKRAYWDDGSPLGSVSNTHCQIDGLVQGWNAIVGLGTKERTQISMNSLEKHLISWKHGEVKLLTPAFSEEQEKNPGYIVTYPPGTRENGATYSHNAVWTAQAFANLGEGNKAMDVLNILNPILRSATKLKADKYRGEPYAMASDIYTEGSYRGRAGWTWYTGSAALYYKTLIESILGIIIKNNVIYFEPCVPSSWKTFAVTYKYKKSTYHIEYINSKQVQTGVKKITCDNHQVEKVILHDDGKKHNIVIVMG